MPSRIIHVVATFAVRPDRTEEFVREATRSLVEPTVGEPGCIRYELCRDAGDPARFAMIECWESQEALDRHLAQPSLQEAVTRLLPLAAEPPQVRRFVPAAAA